MKRGILCDLYVNTAAHSGSYNSGTWDEIDIAQDVNLGKSKETHDTTKRRGKGIKTIKTTLTDIVITGKIPVPDDVAVGNPDYDQWLLFNDAWDADEALDVMALTGPITTNGNSGVRGYFEITKWDLDQANGVALFHDFELRVTDVPFAVLTAVAGAKPLRKVKISGGSPVYAAMGSKVYA